MALFVVILLFSPLGVASGAPQSSGTPFSIALTILPQKLPADGNVYPAVLVSLIDSAGLPTIALNDTTVLLTSSLESVGRVQKIGRASCREGVGGRGGQRSMNETDAHSS